MSCTLRPRPAVVVAMGLAESAVPVPGDTAQVSVLVESSRAGGGSVRATDARGDEHVIGNVNFEVDSTASSLSWVVPSTALSGTYNLHMELESGSSWTEARTFTVLPGLSGNLAGLRQDHVAVVGGSGDEEICRRLSVALRNAPILVTDGLTAGELLPIMQRNDLVLVGGYVVNPLVEELVRLGKSRGGWYLPGDASVEVISDPFPGVAPATNTAVVVAGYEVEDTFLAGMRLLRELETRRPVWTQRQNRQPLGKRNGHVGNSHCFRRRLRFGVGKQRRELGDR